MSFKDFLFKSVFPSFFVSVTYISIAMAILGMTFLPDIQLRYNALLWPVLFGVVSMIPFLLTYSKKELSIKQVIVRKTFFLIVLEIIIVGINYFCGALVSISLAIWLAISVLFIWLASEIILWINDKRAAKSFNDSLKGWQDNTQNNPYN